MESLQDLFEDQLKDLYNAEKQLVKALLRRCAVRELIGNMPHRGNVVGSGVLPKPETCQQSQGFR
jgi:hypothetical protein